jgi:predicted nucleotidyltransferase
MKVDFDTIIKAVLELLPNSEAIYVYGSYANASFRPDSDIDIAIMSKDISAVELWNLSGELSYILNTEVDLVNIYDVGNVLQYEILYKGIRIYAKNIDTTLMEEVRIISICNAYLEGTKDLAEEIIRSGKVYG